MRSVTASLWRFTGTCANGHKFTAHEFPDFQYGDRLIRTSDPKEVALVECMESRDFDEVANMVGALLAEASKQSQASECFDRVFGSACDLSPSGKLYDFTEKVRCPICRTTEIIRYGPGSSPQTDLVELSYVTYETWQRLSAEEKRMRLRNALRDTGCLD